MVESNSNNPVPAAVINIQWHINGKRCIVDAATYVMGKNEIFYLITFVCITFSGMLVAMLETQTNVPPCLV